MYGIPVPALDMILTYIGTVLLLAGLLLRRRAPRPRAAAAEPVRVEVTVRDHCGGCHACAVLEQPTMLLPVATAGYPPQFDPWAPTQELPRVELARQEPARRRDYRPRHGQRTAAYTLPLPS